MPGTERKVEDGLVTALSVPFRDAFIPPPELRIYLMVDIYPAARDTASMR